MNRLEFFLDPEESNNCAGTRVDIFLTDRLEDFSRSAVRKLVDDGDVLVNGVSVKAGCKLKPRDIVSVSVPDPVEPEILPQNIPLDIIYEDSDIIIVNKPQGMVVHPAAGHYTGTLVNALMYHCAGNLSGLNGVMRPGIVHRIDKDTSGLLAVAKNEVSHRSLAAQLAEHSITRIYKAIACGCLSRESAIIDKPIGRHPTDRKKMAVNPRNGRNAVTHYKVLEHFKKHTLTEARLETGRTHQIRVHMSYIGHPLLGDPVYGKPYPGLLGQALHAGVLGFIHPTSNEYIQFEAEPPEYFLSLITKLRS